MGAGGAAGALAGAAVRRMSGAPGAGVPDARGRDRPGGAGATRGGAGATRGGAAASSGGTYRGQPRGAALAVSVALTALVFAVYGRALDAPFVFDDVPGIVENASIRRLWPLVGDAEVRGPLHPPPLAPTARRPLANLSLALDYRLHGLAPAGFRATNLVLHALAAAVLAALVRRTLRLPAMAPAWGAVAWPLSTAVAAVWAVHPLASEAVAYVTQRTEVLAALCYLVTLWAALRHWTAASDGAARAWGAAAVVACVAGVAAKETVVSAPLAVWLYERTFVAGAGRASRARAAATLYGGLAASWLVLVALNARGASGLSDARHAVAPPVWWATQVKVLFLYLKLAVWPWPLAIHYAPRYLATVADAWPWLAAGSVLAAATAALVRGRPAARWIVVVIVLVLAPTFVVPLPKMMAAERRMYLPLAGLVTLALAGGWRAAAAALPRRVAGGAALAAAGVLALVFAGVTARRLDAYGSAIALWEDTVRTQPADAMARYNLGVALLDAGRPPAEAIARFEETLRLDPAHTGALANLGLALERVGRVDEARARFEEALAVDPDDAVAHNNLGALLLADGDAAAALPHLERALRSEPDRPKAMVHRNLGRALLGVGRSAAALAHFDAALRATPDDAEALADRGVALLALDRAADAIPALAAALRIRPDDVPTRNNLGTALRTVGRTAEATEQFTAVLARDPENTTAHFNLGSTLLDGGRAGEAVSHFESVLRRGSADAPARFALARAYAQSGRRADAVAAGERALADARAQGRTALAADLERWLAAYRDGSAPGGGSTRSGSGNAGPPPRSM